MKIGEVSQRLDIPQPTLRYYIKKGLIVPNVKNKQYIFSEQDLQDLEFIIRMREYRLPVQDILYLLSLQRISPVPTPRDIEDQIRVYDNHIGQLRKEERDIRRAIVGLKNTIGGLSAPQLQTPLETGVPLSFLPYLYCPHCKVVLNLGNATIKKQHVLQGKLTCDCGYEADIRDGIVVTRGGHISEYDYYDSDRKLYKEAPPYLISLFQKAYHWMVQQVRQMETQGKTPHIIMENYIDAYFFLYPNIHQMPKNSLYILSDKYYESVRFYKSLIDSMNLQMDILYLADSTLQYPLRPNCVDLFVNFGSCNDHALYGGPSLIDYMDPYLHEGADMLSTYFYFDRRAYKSRKRLMETYPECSTDNYNKAEMLLHLEEMNWRIIADDLAGCLEDTSSESVFTFHEPGEKLYIHAYHCRKGKGNLDK